MKDALEQGREIFIEEAREHLASLESTLLELEDDPNNKDLVASTFRSLHTIKGSGAMFGFDEIADFTHHIETVFDQVREGKQPVTTELINHTLKARDQISRMVESVLGAPGADSDQVEQIRNTFQSFLDPGQTATPFDEASESPSTKVNSPNTYSIFGILFKPNREVFRYGTRLLPLLEELVLLGEAEVRPLLDEVPQLDELDPELCYVGWEITLQTTKDENSIRDVFIFVEDVCEIEIELLSTAIIESGHFSSDATQPIPDGNATDSTPVSPAKTEASEPEPAMAFMPAQTGVPPTTASNKTKPVSPPESGTSPQTPQRKSATAGSGMQPTKDHPTQKDHPPQKDHPKITEMARSVRVASFKLDGLVDLVGELVTVQARLSQLAAGSHSTELLSVAEEVERLTMELRDNTMSIRMLPIGTTFNKFKRLVRDLSQELGKEVVLSTEGADTELDKTVIEQLDDPLIHIIRNCVDHGIESPDVREQAGKPREGSIHLSAFHSGAYVMIQVSDDGKGMDPKAIFNKAVEKGMVLPEAKMSDKEILFLVFQAGFSTAQQVTGVSGRGVGMDVVNRNIEMLRGAVEIDSTLGKGTVLTLKLPLTLAIIDGLLVKIKEDHYILPLSSVEECVELTPDDIKRSHGRHIIYVREEIVPYIRLRDHFNISGKPPEIEQVVVVKLNEMRVGFVVDYVIGEHQTVIKTLGRVYKNLQVFTGATILGDGTVALILDMNKIEKQVEHLLP